MKSHMIKGIIFVSAVGTLFHFIYEWSGYNTIVALFAPINESIWEHTKLIFFPILIYSVYANKKIGSRYPCINSAFYAGALLGVALTITLFYTYTGIIGYHLALADISIFYISVMVSFFIIYKLASSCKVNKYTSILKFTVIMMIFFFGFFTFTPPDIPLFISR